VISGNQIPSANHKKLRAKTNEKFNILLLGPSGSGKTLIINTISEKLSVPVANGDATSYSPTGFQGSDVYSVIHELYLKSNSSLETAQNGIVFIDEIDKLASYNLNNTKSEALHSATQSSMLKLIEGKKVKLPQSLTGEQGPPVLFDTEKVLFCFGGALRDLRWDLRDLRCFFEFFFNLRINCKHCISKCN
jgi:ATP-dependent Clp protease ATP-binding subunit ClpX